MKRTAPFAFGLAFTCLALGACSSSKSSTTTTDSGTPDTATTTDTGVIPAACLDPSTLTDPTNPPADCPPSLTSCPHVPTNTCNTTTTACHASAIQTAPNANLRMGRIRLFAPAALITVAASAVTPAVGATCETGDGTELFNWLLQMNTTTNTLRTGGAFFSATDTFSFLDGQTVTPTQIAAICPGFTPAGGAAGTPVDLSSIMTTLTLGADGTYSTPVVPKLNVPIFTSGTLNSDGTVPVPIVLPLSEVQMKEVSLSADHNCIGSFNGNLACDGDSGGWTTAGSIVGKITLDDAEAVPVKAANCQSLCALLVNDATIVNGHCPTSGGHVTSTGDACVGGTGCTNAFTMSAAFSAYGVTINASTTTTPDAGAD